MTERTWHIEPVSRENLAGLVACHVRCFPRYFLSNLGPRFLMVFYLDFLESPMGLGFVAVDDATGQVMGFVVGNLGDPSFYAWCQKRNRAKKILLVLARLLCSIRLWAQLPPRVVRVLRLLLKRPRRRPDPRAQAEDPAQEALVRYSVASVGVLPEARQKGIARELICAFGQACRTRGASALTLSVFFGNTQARRFYEKTGWVLQEGGHGGIVRYTKALAPACPSRGT